MPAVDWRSLGQKALDLVFTPRCVGCGREGVYLCEPCLEGGRLLDVPYFLEHGGDSFAEAPAVDGVLSCFAMEGVVREAVHHLKYRGLRAIAPTLGGLMARRAKRGGRPADAVVPVPLHRSRLRERGYNQAELLAAEVAKGLRDSVEAKAVERVRQGPPQARAGLEERWTGVQGAFESRRRLDGLRLLLVDDVCTTGATLDACARALKGAGAASVWGLTFAREV